MYNRMPRHILRRFGNAKRFREEKRGLARNIRKVARRLNVGAAYMPTEIRDEAARLLTSAEILVDKMNHRRWKSYDPTKRIPTIPQPSGTRGDE